MQSSDFVDQSDTKKRQVSKHMKLFVQFPDSYDVKGLASYCKAETTFTFHFSIINA